MPANPSNMLPGFQTTHNNKAALDRPASRGSGRVQTCAPKRKLVRANSGKLATRLDLNKTQSKKDIK